MDIVMKSENSMTDNPQLLFHYSSQYGKSTSTSLSMNLCEKKEHNIGFVHKTFQYNLIIDI